MDLTDIPEDAYTGEESPPDLDAVGKARVAGFRFDPHRLLGHACTVALRPPARRVAARAHEKCLQAPSPWPTIRP